MTVEGTFQNGAIVLDNGVQVPDGTRVTVILPEQEPVVEHEPTLAYLLKYAGCIKDMPADFAEQHDHYIHGILKRKGDCHDG